MGKIISKQQPDKTGDFRKINITKHVLRYLN